MHQYAAKNCCGGNACGLDVLSHQLADSEELRGVSVSFHEGRIDYATAGQGLGEKGAVDLADAVRSLGGGSVCRLIRAAESAGVCWKAFGRRGFSCGGMGIKLFSKEKVVRRLRSSGFGRCCVG